MSKTPMQAQYEAIKSEYPDAVLLFRMGDFYEVFDEDAVTASKILGITLTGRGKGDKRREMAGIPHHALPNYLPKLVAAGVKVAIADQMEEAQPGKLVKRKVAKVITPGTVLDENSLEPSKNNYISSIYTSTSGNVQTYYCAFADVSTGIFKLFSTHNPIVLRNELFKLSPAEIVCVESQKERVEIVAKDMYIQPLDQSYFGEEKAFEALTQQFGTNSLRGFGIEEGSTDVIVAGALLRYLEECNKGSLGHITTIKKYEYSEIMQLDAETIRNLELLYPIQHEREGTTLFEILNECKNSMGQRLLRSWIVNPLVSKERIVARHAAVSFFSDSPMLTEQIRDLLKSIYDVERLVSRLGIKSMHPKALVSLKTSLIDGLDILKTINQSNQNVPERVRYMLGKFDSKVIRSVIETIETRIAEDPPANTSETGMIAEGFDSEVDELRAIKKNARQMLANMQKEEIENTNIPSLKISFNKVFGYYIEVTKTHSDKVPANYVRKQTLANAERYITDELKQLEEKIFNSEDRLLLLEQDLYRNTIDDLAKELQPLLDFAETLAEIDVLTNFAHLARARRYVRPNFIESTTQFLEVTAGRHPVVEQITDSFTPNTTVFEENSYIHILTGPNMSGKSTYIRQTALLVLMAQVGSFVPAESMETTIFKRIFTRVGASDNLARGESTFMVEMTETANILNNANEHSLVILDEVGRGTSTFDGVAIAWSIVEYLAEKTKAKTLFATHYHELTALEESYKGIKNFTVDVDDDGEEIVFLHKIIEGSTDKSYGVHVAKLAGVPGEVVSRSEEILKQLEASSAEELKIENSRFNTEDNRVNSHQGTLPCLAADRRRAQDDKEDDGSKKEKGTSGGGAQRKDKPVPRAKRISAEQMSLL